MRENFLKIFIYFKSTAFGVTRQNLVNNVVIFEITATVKSDIELNNFQLEWILKKTSIRLKCKALTSI